MAFFYRPVVRDQVFLLPPDMRDWLPPDHLVWTVLDIVAVVDTSAFHRRSRRGSVGREGYDPDLMLGLLVYAYAVGVRSTRAIERRCLTDVAFKVACAQDVPDHSTLARFRQDHQDAFVDLFERVLTLAVRAGLGQFGTIAIDGTKIAADASLDANRTGGWVRARAEEIVAEAAALDAAEDAQGDVPDNPAGWSDHKARREQIEQLAAELDRAPGGTKAHRSQRRAARHEADLQAGKVPRGRAPNGADRVAAAQIKLDRAIARQQAVLDRRSARAAAGAPRGRTPKPVEQHAGVIAARERLAAEQAAAEQAAPTTPAPAPQQRVNLTDPQSRIQPTRKGWVQGYNAQLAVTSDQIIVACSLGQNPTDAPQFVPMMNAATATATRLAAATGRDTTIGTVLADAGYASRQNLTAPGPDRLIALGKSRNLYAAAKANPAAGDPDPDQTPRERMAHRLATPEGAALYKRRGATVEPGIGNLKKLLPRFSRRGLDAATSELNLAAAAFNLLKIHHHALA